MWEDYYKILEVDFLADQATIKKSYRRLAKKYHPDVNNASNAKSRFQKIEEAYRILKDQSSRRQYNQEYSARRANEDTARKKNEEKKRKAEAAKEKQKKDEDNRRRDEEVRRRNEEARRREEHERWKRQQEYERAERIRLERERLKRQEAERRRQKENLLMGLAAGGFGVIVIGFIFFLLWAGISTADETSKVNTTPKPKATERVYSSPNNSAENLNKLSQFTPTPVPSTPSPTPKDPNERVICEDSNPFYLTVPNKRESVKLRKDCWVKVEIANPNRYRYIETDSESDKEYIVECSNTNSSSRGAFDVNYKTQVFSGYVQGWKYMECFKPAYFKALDKPLTLEIWIVSFFNFRESD